MDNLFELQGEILMKGVDEVKSQLKEISADVKTTSSTMQDGSAASAGLSKSMSTLASAAVAGAVVIALRKVISTAKELVSTYKTAAQQNITLNTVLKATGNQIGVYNGELEEYADELQNLTGISDETIKAAEQILIATQALDKDGLKRATADAADLSYAMGTDAASAAKTLAFALQDPAEGLSRLKRAGMSFTDAEIAQIKAMQEAGDMAGAQVAVLEKIERKYKGIAQAVGDVPVGTLDKLDQTWGDIKENLGQAILDSVAPALNKLLDVLREVKRITAGYTAGAKDVWNLFAGDKIDLEGYLAGDAGSAFSITATKQGGGWARLSDDDLLTALVGFNSNDLKSAKEMILEQRDQILDTFDGGIDEFNARLKLIDNAIEQAIERETAVDPASIEASFIEKVSTIIGTDDEIGALERKIANARDLLMMIPDMYDPDNIDEATQTMIDKLEAQIETWQEELEDALNAGAYKPTDYLAEYNKQVAELSLQLLAIDEQIEQAQEAGAKAYLESKRDGLIKTFNELVNGGKELEEALDYIREYNEKVADLTDKIAVLDRQIEQTKDPATLRYLEDTRKGLQDELDTLTKIDDAALAWNIKIQTALQDIQSELGSFASETTRLFGQITAAITRPWTEAVTQIDADLKALSESTRKEQDDIKAAYNAGVISYEQYVERTQKAREAAKAKEDELNRQKNEANRKAFEANKANSLAQAVINAAQSITSIWAQYGAQPIVAAALTAISAAATGIEVGTIASQEYVPALARGGIVDKPTIAQIGERGREAIVPLENNTEWTGGVANALAPVLDGNRRQAERQTELLEKLVDATEKGRIIELDGKKVSKALAPDMNKALGEQYRQTQRGY